MTTDANRFGAFIAALRKEKGLTQAQLGRALGVTDKAVSKWERGLCFPDIGTIEPLARALGVSVMEIMKSEKMYSPAVTGVQASEAILNALDLAARQRRRERKALYLILIFVFVLLSSLLLAENISSGLIDAGTLFLTLGLVFLPLFCLFSGAAVLLYALVRKIRGLPCLQSAAVGAGLLLVPLAVAVFFFLCGALGLGPVPS